MTKQKLMKNSPDIHLCWDCVKASVPGQCPAYESITKIIEKNFDSIKILFHIPECEFFIEEE